MSESIENQPCRIPLNEIAEMVGGGFTMAIVAARPEKTDLHALALVEDETKRLFSALAAAGLTQEITYGQAKSLLILHHRRCLEILDAPAVSAKDDQ